MKIQMSLARMVMLLGAVTLMGCARHRSSNDDGRYDSYKGERHDGKYHRDHDHRNYGENRHRNERRDEERREERERWFRQ